MTSSAGIYWCTSNRLYVRRPCQAGPTSLLYGHEDVPVGDVLTIGDIATHDMGGELYEEWRIAGNRPPAS